MTDPRTRRLQRFLNEVRARAPATEIVTGSDCAALYRDPFAVVAERSPAPAALRPASAGDVREIVRAAAGAGRSLWPISRGENLGYGGAAPFDPETLVLDLSRMDRILEVSAEDAYCLVEPGVSFVQMFDYLERHDLPLWLSVPGYGLGSLAGNALERGTGHSPYGDHAARICGLEVVLADGDLVRTGMGALPGSGMWQRQPSVPGPRLEELFVQSSFGIVTKLGLRLMPAPEASAAVEIDLDERDTLAALVEALAPLKRAGIIQDSPVIASYLTLAALRSTRTSWSASGPLDEAAAGRLREAMGLGWWNAKLRLYGIPEMVEPALARVEQALDLVPGCRLRISRWRRGEPLVGAHRGIPSADGLANVGWHGPGGAHLDFAVAIPLSGAAALRQARHVMEAVAAAGLDYHSAFYLRDRHVLNVTQLLFDRADAAMRDAVDRLYRRLIDDAARQGFGLHRVPVRYRAAAMAPFQFGDGALARLSARLKRAMDPEMILSPGKDGFQQGAE